MESTASSSSIAAAGASGTSSTVSSMVSSAVSPVSSGRTTSSAPAPSSRAASVRSAGPRSAASADSLRNSTDGSPPVAVTVASSCSDTSSLLLLGNGRFRVAGGRRSAEQLQDDLGETEVEAGHDRHHDHHEDDHDEGVGDELVARGPQDLAHLGDGLTDETRRGTAAP